MAELNYYFIALMIFIFGLGVIIVAGSHSAEGSPPTSIGKYISGGLILGIIMLILSIFLGLLLLLKYLWIGLVG